MKKVKRQKLFIFGKESGVEPTISRKATFGEGVKLYGAFWYREERRTCMRFSNMATITVSVG